MTQTKEARKAYYLANRERESARRKERYLANRERELAQCRAYKVSHQESIMAYELANRVRILDYKKAYDVTVRHSYRSVIDVPDGMVVHHLNHDHNDNRRTNLLVMTQSDHASYHGYMRYGNYEKASQIIYNYEVTQ
jgi:hypothetical protein